jgi:hypothetical protein
MKNKKRKKEEGKEGYEAMGERAKSDLLQCLS